MKSPPVAVARLLAGLFAGALIAGCVAEETASPSPSVTPAATDPSTASPDATPTGTPAASPATPTPTTEPALSLDLPPERDEREVEVALDVAVPADAGGQMTVTVTSLADSMIEELVLRWPAGLHDTLFPAPFVASDDRISDAAPPLVQPWTKWVLGPGERGEPGGTVSLGYGPLPPGGTLEIPLFVERRAPGPVAFDLQLLADEALLQLPDGEPAELRVEVP